MIHTVSVHHVHVSEDNQDTPERFDSTIGSPGTPVKGCAPEPLVCRFGCGHTTRTSARALSAHQAHCVENPKNKPRESTSQKRKRKRAGVCLRTGSGTYCGIPELSVL